MALQNTTLVMVDEWFALPEDSARSELIDGELFMAPPPDCFHQDISRNIVGILYAYLRKHSIGKVYHAPIGLVLDESNGFQPDVLFISNERRPLITRRAIEGAPEFIVEILSRGTAHLDRGIKRRAYAKHGVKEYWIIDPGKQLIEIYHLEKDPERPVFIRGATDTFTSALFPNLTFSGQEIFQA